MSLFVPQQPNAPAAPDQAPNSQGKARPGFSDALGDRELSMDNTIGTTVEILKFKKEFGDATPFEAALRKRVDDLRRMLHPSLPTLRAVDRLPGGELALISDHVPGRRLSEILQTARGPVFAVELIRQLTPALATIQRPNPELSHGLVTADRVIVTREGRLVIVEHALGSAIESLKLPAAKLRSQFGLAMQDTSGPVRLDQRMDVIQLGFVALTLLLGRRIDPTAFRVGIPALLDEFTQASPRDSAAMRPWFERALQIGERPFETAEDALDAIEELPENDELGHKGPQRSILMFRAQGHESPAPLRAVPAPERAAPNEKHSALPPEKAEKKELAKFDAQPPVAARAAAAPTNENEEEIDEDDDRFAETETDDMATTARTNRKMMWVAAGFAVLSAAQAAVIVMLVMRQSPTLIPAAAAAPLEPVASAPAPAPVTLPPLTAPAPAATPTAAAATPAVTTKPAETAPAEAAPLAGRIGGVRVTSSVELQVFQDGSLLGTTAGPIALPEGSHTLDFVNESLGYRSRQTVAVKAGQLAAVRLTLPQGRININATPWANVWINGNAAGETPIANLTLPIGNHEIVFRHPQLGEQRLTATVKADGVARISASFQR
jgi:hypothetical protein